MTTKIFDRPIIIQKQNTDTEEWSDLYTVHASINKSSSDNTYLGSGASQSKRNLTFEIRYFAGLEKVGLDRQYYRIIYRGEVFDIEDYDDYMLQHETVKFYGMSY